MQSFVTQPGVPLIVFGDGIAGAVPATQTRFFLASQQGNGGSGNVPDPSQSWTLPVCLKSNAAPICRVLNPTDQTVPIPAGAASPLFYANASGKGYYRTAYTPTQYAAIAAKAQSALTALERIGLLGDRWALVRAGRANVGELLSLIFSFKHDPDAAVLDTALSKVRAIETLIASDEDRDRLNAILRRELEPVYTALGPPNKHDSYDRQQLRAILFETLGDARDTAVLAQANQITARVFSGSKPDKSLDPMFADAAIALAATTGDDTYYAKTLALSKLDVDPGLQSDALRLLTHFVSPQFVNRTLDYDVSGEVRNQDSWILLAALLQQRETQQQTWDYIRHNWDKVRAQFTTNSGVRIVAATSSFCTQQKRDEVAAFFAAHPVEASERTLAKSLDSIDACIQLRAAQEPDLHQWLATQPN
jgi:aminopeptidase N